MTRSRFTIAILAALASAWRCHAQRPQPAPLARLTAADSATYAAMLERRARGCTADGATFVRQLEPVEMLSVALLPLTPLQSPRSDDEWMRQIDALSLATWLQQHPEGTTVELWRRGAHLVGQGRTGLFLCARSSGSARAYWLGPDTTQSGQPVATWLASYLRTLRTVRRDSTTVAHAPSVSRRDAEAVLDSVAIVESILGLRAQRPLMIVLYRDHTEFAAHAPDPDAAASRSAVARGAGSLALVHSASLGSAVHELVHLALSALPASQGSRGPFPPYAFEEALARALDGRALARISAVARRESRTPEHVLQSALDSWNPDDLPRVRPSSGIPIAFDGLAVLLAHTIVQCGNIASLLTRPDLLEDSRALRRYSADAAGVDDDRLLPLAWRNALQLYERRLLLRGASRGRCTTTGAASVTRTQPPQARGATRARHRERP